MELTYALRESYLRMDVFPLAYNKSITLLFEQSKLILNEPFYTSTECQQLQWPTDIASLDDQDDMMNSVLCKKPNPCLFLKDEIG